MFALNRSMTGERKETTPGKIEHLKKNLFKFYVAVKR